MDRVRVLPSENRTGKYVSALQVGLGELGHVVVGYQVIAVLETIDIRFVARSL